MGTTVAEVAKMEERTRGRRATGRKAARGKRKVASEKPELAGRVVKQDTLQLGVEKVATEICMPLKRRTVSIVKKPPISKKICKHGVCWKHAKMSSGSQ